MPKRYITLGWPWINCSFPQQRITSSVEILTRKNSLYFFEQKRKAYTWSHIYIYNLSLLRIRTFCHHYNILHNLLFLYFFYTMQLIKKFHTLFILIITQYKKYIMKNFDRLKFIETVSIDAVRATYHLRMRVSPMGTQLIYVCGAHGIPRFHGKWR